MKSVISLLTGVKETKKHTVEKIGEDQIPIGQRFNGNLVCLPVGKEPPCLGVTGPRGTGKTSFVHGFVERLWHYYACNVIILNDTKVESQAWIYPNDNKEQVAILTNKAIPSYTDVLIGLNEEPQGLPIHPISLAYNTPPDEDIDKFSPTLNEVRVSTSWFDLIKLEEASAFAEDFFTSISTKLVKAKNLDEMLNIVEAEKDVPKNVKIHLKWRLRTVFNTPEPYPVINNQKNEVHSLERFFELLDFNEIPSVMNHLDGQVENYVHFYYSALLEEIFKRKREAVTNPEKFSPIFRKQLYIILLELSSVMDTQNQRNGAALSLIKIEKRGRQAGIGVIWEEQDYSKVPQLIRNQTNYMIAFRQQGEPNIKKMVNDLGLDEKVEKDLPQLGLGEFKYEFYIIPKDAPLVIKHPDGRNDTTWFKPLKVFALPPLSKHLGTLEKMKVEPCWNCVEREKENAEI